MSKKDTKLEIREAFRLWSGVTDLRFTERSYGPVHINITFVTCYEGDDGDHLESVVSHSYPPVMGGLVTLYADQVLDSGNYLRHAAAHGIGHALGLPHTGHSSSLMSPALDKRSVVGVAKLGQEDVAAIQRLYGINTRKPLPTIKPSLSTTQQKHSLWDKSLP